MLRIRNVLTESPQPTVADFDDKDLSKGFNPMKERGFSADALRLWEKYFEFLFASDGIGLHDKLKKFTKAEAIKSRLQALNEFLKIDDDNVNNNNLLKLLLVRPDDSQIDEYLQKVKKKSDLEKVKRIFNYSTATKKDSFKEFVYLLGVPVCPYCGRAFTTTAKLKRGAFHKTNQIDHFIPQAKYPHLALSIWNLIPSCASCNLAKRDKDFKNLPYPYAEGFGDLYRFNFDVTKSLDYMIEFGTSVDWKPSLTEYRNGDDSEVELLSKLKNEAQMLHIEELYSSHANYVRDICLQRMIFNDAYIDEMLEKYSEHFKSRAEIRRLLYMKSIDSDKIGSMPLDKLTRDVDMQIDELIKKSRTNSF